MTDLLLNRSETLAPTHGPKTNIPAMACAAALLATTGLFRPEFQILTHSFNVLVSASDAIPIAPAQPPGRSWLPCIPMSKQSEQENLVGFQYRICGIASVPVENMKLF